MARLCIPTVRGFVCRELREDFTDSIKRASSLCALFQVARRWREATFQPREPAGTALKRLRDEVDEFFENPSPGEAADILLFLDAWACEHAIDLRAAVRDKMTRNLAATFVRGDDGVYERVRVPPSPESAS